MLKIEFLFSKFNFFPFALDPLFFEAENINDFSLFGHGIQIAPAIGSKSLSKAIEIAKFGMPFTKFVVPSSGSRIHSHSTFLSKM